VDPDRLLAAVRPGSHRLTVAAPAVATVLAIAMGLSRVYLGHHWLTDVLVGWTLGAAWLAVIITCHRLALSRLPLSTPGAGKIPEGQPRGRRQP
jgi:membrane-associated phospholipid phosphatase